MCKEAKTLLRGRSALDRMTQTTDHSTLWRHGAQRLIDNCAVAHSRTLPFFRGFF
jgi:hypothetical protein